jgi:hypothetical protein
MTNNSADPLRKDRGVREQFGRDQKVDDQYVVRDTNWRGSIQKFYTDVSVLIEREGQLIRTEIGEKTTQVKTATILFASAGVILFVGAICLSATAIILLSYVIPTGLSAIMVTAVFLIVGAVMLGTAKNKLDADNLVPRKSIDALADIRYSLKEKVNEITKH